MATSTEGGPVGLPYDALRAAEVSEVSASLLREACAASQAMGTTPLTREIEAIARSSRISLEGPSPVASDSSAAQRLTAREREVLAHLVTGRSYADIAATLFISAKTVSVHVSNVLRETGTTSGLEAAEWARRNHVTDI